PALESLLRGFAAIVDVIENAEFHAERFPWPAGLLAWATRSQLKPSIASAPRLILLPAPSHEQANVSNPRCAGEKHGHARSLRKRFAASPKNVRHSGRGEANECVRRLRRAAADHDQRLCLWRRVGPLGAAAGDKVAGRDRDDRGGWALERARRAHQRRARQ